MGKIINIKGIVYRAASIDYVCPVTQLYDGTYRFNFGSMAEPHESTTYAVFPNESDAKVAREELIRLMNQ